MGLLRMGGCIRQCLIFSKVFWQLSVHPFVPVFRIAKKKSRNSSVKRAIKRPSATSLPVRRYNSFLFLGGGVSMTALTWSGLTSMPLWLTINPKNLPALTPKAHLEGFSFMPYFLKRWKTYCKWRTCSPRVLLLTTISSIYTSTVWPIRGLKIFVISLW